MNLVDENLQEAKPATPSPSYPSLARLVESNGFNRTSLAMIFFSALILGLETDRELYKSSHGYFVLLDRGILAFFTLEIGLRIFARMPRPAEYFKDAWNLFDCAVVLVCYLPLSGQYAAVLRLLRVLRTLRLLTHIPRLRLIVETMLRSLSSMGYISMLLGLLFYIYGVIAVFSFAELAPSYFGSLSVAVLTLFQIVTLEGWVEILNELKIEFPLAGPAFLISFIVLGTMIVLNLFIGVIVNSLAEAQSDFRVDDKTLAAEELRASVALLHRRLDEIVVPSRPVHDNQEGVKSPGMTSGKQLDGIVRP